MMRSGTGDHGATLKEYVLSNMHGRSKVLKQRSAKTRPVHVHAFQV